MLGNSRPISSTSRPHLHHDFFDRARHTIFRRPKCLCRTKPPAMLTKKPAILLSSYNALSAPQSTRHHPTTSCNASARLQPQRTYATVKDEVPLKDEAPEIWPKAAKPHKIPTPYQILNLQREAPYIKTDRFYELVKIYHPDRGEHPSALPHAHLTQSLRIERYRLIIAAHALLSDPSKRRAYDLYGAGWSGASTRPPSFNYSEDAKKAAMSNATWEDWEDWYSKFRTPSDPPRQAQAPLYTSNTTFISIIAILAALGGVGQATRVEGNSASFIAQRDAAHSRAARTLASEKARSYGMTRQERIEEFLRNRDPEAYDDESVRKLLLDPDVCAGETAAPSGGRDHEFRRRYE
jgi:curved DNA-binding protein CbpA